MEAPLFVLQKPQTDDPKELVEYRCTKCGALKMSIKLDAHAKVRHGIVEFGITTQGRNQMASKEQELKANALRARRELIGYRVNTGRNDSDPKVMELRQNWIKARDELRKFYVGESDSTNYDRIAAVATSDEAGVEYAEVLGLSNYIIMTSMNRAQGLRFRAIVVTPGYLQRAEKARWESQKVYDALLQSAVVLDVPMG